MKKFNITVNGTAYEVEVEEVRAAGAAAPRAAAPAPALAAAPAPAAPAASAAPAKAAGAGEQSVDAPMPGKIIEVKVSVGQAVKAGDTLWDIAERYTAKSTGTRRYILEYKEGIYENNPWLVERGGLIRPGDKLTLTYWVKSEEEQE